MSDRRTRRALAITVVMVAGILVLVALIAGNASTPGSPTFPPAGATTPPAGAAAAATRTAVEAALASVGVQTEVAQTPYRPAEAARVAAAPRLVLRAILAQDPDHGHIVIYEFLTPNDANVAATEQAAYVGSGVGRVQFPTDTQFVIRVVGSTIVFYAWSPASSLDPAAARIAEALGTLAVDVSVPG